MTDQTASNVIPLPLWGRELAGAAARGRVDWAGGRDRLSDRAPKPDKRLLVLEAEFASVLRMVRS